MMWSLKWDHENARRSIAAAADYGQDFIEIPLIDIPSVDAKHTRALLEKYRLRAVCSLVLPEPAWASVRPDAAIDHLNTALDKAAEIGAEALTGVTYGGTNERTGFPPTQGEYDNLTRALSRAAGHAKTLGLQFGIETVNRYENHLLNSAEQAVALVERIGADNVFIHLDTFHMNMEEKGITNGIITARNHLKYMHMSESDRGTPGFGNVAWDEVFSALAAIDFKGVLTLESFAAMPEEMAGAISTWRPVAPSADEVLDKGLAFLRDKANQYRIF
ncbi:D-psicose/D-tagatose/L-ribulose 3-epimerase [Agrobacterium tumefaciens]|uniref:D-psicose/D-tagatose/L-ribulose 3-epimerase n=2 Tax=Rhizobium/Agrobacterium group TaxID=227290 RepID=A0ABR6JDP5_AGRRD|nr:sugar phosphate isomerase/epimerase [Agrobacterium tumefaciens]MBB4283550.1 D-psicose/D-tagatose/L-ribulose 3-epimerase [Agrobacterium radiobacter]MBB4325481.1 D-psicose/D-tagatose/L-ribulose 3-epimerase [Agrobacterium radiobacter]MBB4337786.1 D-psicose/D-tagatose/L-ribulose 3-epimerase [Agrobacterium radiobacter]MBB4458782.1 D-psicose/D-tagatose/L-ribulose 3-epimerase [Agrobacterium radiobacter]MBB4463321.1 D-psicose/D-tagatose/L-ribulose 3-epimerase [Agrobacterium radiobacter]